MRTGQIFTVVSDQSIDRKIDFADQHAVAEFVDHASHLRNHVQRLRSIRGIDRQQRLVWWPARVKIRIGRVVSEFRILDQMPEYIDAKAIDTFPKPETHNIVDRLTDRRIAPVQIGLLSEEGVIIILLCAGVVTPGAAAKFRHPVIWGGPVSTGLAPEIPIALLIIA